MARGALALIALLSLSQAELLVWGEFSFYYGPVGLLLLGAAAGADAVCAVELEGGGRCLSWPYCFESKREEVKLLATGFVGESAHLSLLLEVDYTPATHLEALTYAQAASSTWTTCMDITKFCS